MSLSGAADLGVCETLFVPPEELLFGLPPVLKFARLTDPEVDRLSSQYKCVCCLLLSKSRISPYSAANCVICLTI